MGRSKYLVKTRHLVRTSQVPFFIFRQRRYIKKLARGYTKWETMGKGDTLAEAKAIRRGFMHSEMRKHREDDREWAIFYKGKAVSKFSLGVEGQQREPDAVLRDRAFKEAKRRLDGAIETTEGTLKDLKSRRRVLKGQFGPVGR